MSAPTGPDLPSVTRHVDLDVDADELWRCVVDDQERAAWWGGETALEVAPGGTGHATEPDGSVRRIVVDDVTDAGPDGRNLTFRWWPEDGGPASRVDLVVVPRPGGSRLTVTESLPAAVPAPFRATMCAGRLLDLELLLLCRRPSLAAGA